MYKNYMILYMDTKDELEDCDRKIFDFIIHCEDEYEFDKKMKKILENNKLSWDKNKEGYDNIFSVKQVNLTNVVEY